MSGVVVSRLTKQYASVLALDDVSLEFEKNTIYGLLGRNGAGKSTLLSCIANFIFPDSGEITVEGRRVFKDSRPLKQMYFMSESTYYPETMKIREVFRWTKQFYPDFDEGKAQKTAELFGLGLRQSVGSLSTGYTSIFKLVIALCVNTPYLFLDEPVLGLDANHRELFYRLLLEKYAEAPCTIVISTHLIEEIAHMVEKIIILKEGKILCSENTETLIASGYTVSGKASSVDAYIAGKEVLGVDQLGGLKTAYLMGKVAQPVPEDLEITGMDLQKLFVQLTNR